MSYNEFWSQAIEKEHAARNKWNAHYRSGNLYTQYYNPYEGNNATSTIKAHPGTISYSQQPSRTQTPQASNRAFLQQQAMQPTVGTNIFPTNAPEHRDPNYQVHSSGRDPQAPKRRAQSARRVRQEWPYNACDNPQEHTSQYSDYLHRLAIIPSPIPRQASVPTRWSTGGVSVAYNSAYPKLGHTSHFGLRSLDPQAGSMKSTATARHPHPATDGMSTRKYAFPASCPVHSYAPLPDWTKQRTASRAANRSARRSRA